MGGSTPSPVATEQIGFAGRVRDLPVRQLLRLLCLSSRTGRLRLSDGNKRAQIDLDEGKVIRAWTLESHANLGDILCRRQLISTKALAEAVAIQSSGPERVPLGQILVRLGFVTADDVNDAMREQVQAAILEVVKWSNGEFTFEDTLSTAVDEIAVAVPEVLLFSGSRTRDGAANPAPVKGAASTAPAALEAAGPISSQPILCLGKAPDWPGLVARLAESYPGATVAAPGENPMTLLRRIASGHDGAAVLLDARYLHPGAEHQALDLMRKIRRNFKTLAVLVVHTGLSSRQRQEFRRAGAAALIDLSADEDGIVSVERTFLDFTDAMSLALISRRHHALEDSCC